MCWHSYFTWLVIILCMSNVPVLCFFFQLRFSFSSSSFPPSFFSSSSFSSFSSSSSSAAASSFSSSSFSSSSSSSCSFLVAIDFFDYISRMLILCQVVCKYFFPFCWMSFHSTDHSTVLQKFLSLECFHLLSFALVLSKKFSPMSMSWNVSGSSSSRNFMVSSLRFRSLTHFELIFVYSKKCGCNFIFLHIYILFCHYHWLNR